MWHFCREYHWNVFEYLATPAEVLERFLILDNTRAVVEQMRMDNAAR